MKILQLIPWLGGGGAERFSVDLSNTLSPKHDVSLLTFYDPTAKEFYREEIGEHVTTHSLGKKRGFDYRIFKRLYSVIQQINPDVIHSHLRSINYLAAVYPLLKNTPVVYTIHSNVYEDCPNSIIRSFRKKMFCQKAVIPVTISEESSKNFQQAYKLSGSKPIYNGRVYPGKSKQFPMVTEQVERLKKNSKTKVFVHIGRFTPEKNQIMLINTFTRLVENDNINAVLLIIGRERDNEESRWISQQLKEADGNYKYIHLLGEHANATDYLHAADYFCLSSTYEGMPITLIEAFATGCIPVCTRAGGIPEMIHGLEPSLVPKSCDHDDYYQLLKYAVNLSSAKQQAIKKRGGELFKEKYSMEHCAAQYLSLYKSLLQEE